MPNKMPSFKRKTLRVLVLKLNEDPVREMTICHAPKRKDKDLNTCWLTLNPKPSGSRLQGFLSQLFTSVISVFNHSHTLFPIKPLNPTRKHHFQCIVTLLS